MFLDSIVSRIIPLLQAITKRSCNIWCPFPTAIDIKHMQIEQTEQTEQLC